MLIFKGLIAAVLIAIILFAKRIHSNEKLLTLLTCSVTVVMILARLLYFYNPKIDAPRMHMKGSEVDLGFVFLIFFAGGGAVGLRFMVCLC